MFRSALTSFFVAFALVVSSQSALAQKRDMEAEINAAFEAARAVAIAGPADVPVAGHATLKLPEHYVFIPRQEADQILKAMGNGSDPNRQGLIFPEQGNWFVVVNFTDSGYIRDEEAKEWDAEEMLKNIRQGTEHGNKERTALGIPEMEILGWAQRPKYDQDTHRLVWSIESKDRNSAADSPRGINYNTLVLGREGYVSLNLVTASAELGADKPHAETLLAATSFNSGKRYEDFNAGTDRVAEYGIATLIAGAAAKKLGFFAVLGVFLLKFSKLFGIAAVGLVALLTKLLGRRGEDKPSDSAGPSTQ